MNKKKQGLISFLFIFTLFIVFSPLAEAHVTVNPSSSETNAYEKYGVRVPVEKDINTTELTLNVPDDVNVISVEPATNWDHVFETDDNDKITAITWTANAGGIGPNEYAEFSFIGVNPDKAGELSWEAFQTYEDGSVVEWVDAPGSEEPASVTNVVEGGDDSSDSASTASGTSGWLPLVLASVALILSLISLFRKRA